MEHHILIIVVAGGVFVLLDLGWAVQYPILAAVLLDSSGLGRAAPFTAARDQRQYTTARCLLLADQMFGILVPLSEIIKLILCR